MNTTPLFNYILNAQYGYDGLVNKVIGKSLVVRKHVNSMLRVAMNRYNQGDIYNAKLFINVAERTLDE